MTPRSQPFTILAITGLTNAMEPRLRNRSLISVTPKTLAKLAQFTGADTESAEWLGLTTLVQAVALYPGVSVQVWNVSKKLLLRDIQRAPYPDASVFYKRVFEEGIGTFGGQAIGLMVVDAYLSSDRNDSDLANGIQYVAAAAGAPALIGISEEFEPASEWQHLFALRAPSRRGTGAWLHPGYLVASRVAAAMQDADLGEAAARLLPDWRPPLTDPRQDALDAECELASPADNLARVVLSGQIRQRVQDHIRMRHISESGAAFAGAVRVWFATNIPVNLAGEPLMTLGNVAILKDKLSVEAAWHPEAGGGIEAMDLLAPGIRGG